MSVLSILFALFTLSKSQLCIDDTPTGVAFWLNGNWTMNGTNDGKNLYQKKTAGETYYLYYEADSVDACPSWLGAPCWCIDLYKPSYSIADCAILVAPGTGIDTPASVTEWYDPDSTSTNDTSFSLTITTVTSGSDCTAGDSIYSAEPTCFTVKDSEDPNGYDYDDTYKQTSRVWWGATQYVSKSLFGLVRNYIFISTYLGGCNETWMVANGYTYCWCISDYKAAALTSYSTSIGYCEWFAPLATSSYGTELPSTPATWYFGDDPTQSVTNIIEIAASEKCGAYSVYLSTFTILFSFIIFVIN